MKKFITTFLLSAALVLLPFADIMTVTAGQSRQTNLTDYSAVFDADYYYQTYSDLQQNIGHDPAALLKHFITMGMQEGRSGNAAFQVKAYMYYNPDLIAVYGVDDLSSYYIHYICVGKTEGRKALFEKKDAFPKGTLASYSTTYNVTEDRAVNVELAASRMNGITVPAGETFSFSDSIDTRTLENGYVVAPSFASGKIVSSVGGGICQVSSTLYVTMLLSAIPATQHYFHSLPVDYVPAGLDAAIVEGYKDLKFKNNFNYPIKIQASAKDGLLTVSIVKA